MGKADAATKVYISKNDIFADAFNFYLYGGRPVIKPERLRELNAEELILPYGSDGAVSPEQKLRDSFKELAAMEDGRNAYLLLGAENQLNVHYAAPVKALSYDVIQYARQVQAAADSHRKEKNFKGRTAGEFLSGFYKNDKLLPVITLILFFSPDHWDGPRTLREMMSTDDPAILDLLPEYKIHLISPAELEEQDLNRFHSSLGNVMTFIKYSKDKKKLVNWINQNQESLTLGKAEVDVLNTCVKANLTMNEEKEEMGMCQALIEWRADVKEEVREEVKAEVREEARAEARAELRDEVRAEVKAEVREELQDEVRAEVREELQDEVRAEVRTELQNKVREELLVLTKNVMDSLKTTAKQAMDILKISEADRSWIGERLQA